MSDMLFCAASLLFLVWVIRLKLEIDDLKREVEGLRERLQKYGQKVSSLSRPRPPPQSVLWKGPPLVAR